MRVLRTAVATLLISGTTGPLLAQCPIAVNAGPDITVCNPGESAQLNGSISGSYLAFSWSPTSGLGNSNSLNPSATVTGTQTYTLTAQAIDPNAPNLLPNGNFEALNTGFTSSYSFNPTPTTPGTYTITTSPALVLSTFPPCDDHTYGNGLGNLMLVNGAGTPGANVFCSTVSVIPNTWYALGAWVISSPLFPPQFQFTVNGSPAGAPYQASSQGCNWQQFTGSWFSGSATTATVCVTTLNSGNGLFGDDYALDDITFTQACSASDEVSVSVAQVNATLPLTAFLPCNASQTGIQLNGSSSSSGSNITFQWSGPGILSGASTPIATVNATGTYTLTVTFAAGGTLCTDEATIEVLPDPNIALANVAAPGSLNCSFPSLTLDGGGSSSGGTISYSWTYTPSQGGSPPGISSGGNTQYPQVNQPGTYTLTVTNSVSGCTATASATVNVDFTPPLAFAPAPGALSCSNPSLTLSGVGSSTGSSFSYLWSTVNGNIISGSTTLNNCVINAPGNYLLTVTNTQNGCTATATAVVGGNNTPPQAAASSPSNLNCNTPTVQLSGTGSSQGAGISYLWTHTPPGGGSGTGIISGASGLSPLVNQAGTYTLIVTNQANGCTASASVSVSGDAVSPQASATPTEVLGCTTSSLTLNGSGSSQGANFDYLWNYIPPPGSSASGILSGANSLSPEVNAPGFYVLTVTNTMNGCTATDSTSVVQDGNAPTVLIQLPDTLTCTADTIFLDAGNSSSGGNISIEWSFTPAPGAGGNGLVAGANTFFPAVDAPGTYTLTLADTANDCISSASVFVFQNTAAPLASAGPDTAITCVNPLVALDGNASSQGNGFSYQWSTSGGGFAGGQQGLSPVVNAPASYVLLVTDTGNGCTAADTVLVLAQNVPPVSEAGNPDTLDCLQTSLALNGTGSAQGPGLAYSWTYFPAAGGTPPGILSGQTDLNPVVNGAGWYFLSVFDSLSGCHSTDSVLVTLWNEPPSLEPQLQDTLDCLASQVSLQSLASSGPEFSYQWTTADGNILGGDTTATALVDAPGTYFILVTNNLNGCTAEGQVTVFGDTLHPVAVAGPSFTLSCAVTSAQLDGSASSSGAGLNYQWSTANGNILSGANTLTPSINAPGTYELIVTNSFNGCTSSDQTTVLQDGGAPVADAGNPLTLTCSQPSASLDGSGSDAGSDITYQWATQGGSIVSGGNTLFPVVDAPGTYVLTVTNNANNCQSISAVQVLEDSQPPVVSIATPGILTCMIDQTTLAATVSGADNPGLSWTTSSGLILSGGGTASPVVAAPGLYTLTATNPQNGCTAAAAATVLQDILPPQVQIEVPQVLNCQVQQINLNGSGSSQGGSFTYSWTTTGGNIVSGANGLTPLVDAPGTYLLSITSQSNGCSAMAAVSVAEDLVPPLANAGPAPSFGCSPGGILQLNGSGSSTGSDFTYNWIFTPNPGNPGGGILSGGTTLTPSINAPGLYTLSVTNGQNGCSASDTVFVAGSSGSPVCNIAAPVSLNCALTQLTLDATASSQGAAFDYDWATANGQILSGGNTPAPLIAAPGVYVLTITNNQNSCTCSAQVTVAQNITPPGAAAQGDTLTCKETAVALVGSSPTLNVSYQWATANGNFLFGQNTPTPGVDEPGLYTLTVTNPANGCTSSASVTVVRVELESFGVQEVNADCINGRGSVLFSGVNGGTPPFRYSIDGGQTFSDSPLFEDLLPGFYDLEVKDAEGCRLYGTARVEEPPSITISLPTDVTVNLGETWEPQPGLNIPASSIGQVNWTPSGVQIDCDTCLRPVIRPLEDGLYTLSVLDDKGCTATASTFITVLQRVDVYVPNVFSPNGDGINDVLILFAKPGQIANVRAFNIFSRWGEALFEERDFQPNDPSAGWDGTHRGKIMNPGVYIWWAEVELLNGVREILKGDVMLMR